jgi:NAD dependent epimerase/dehydratase family enzyme
LLDARWSDSKKTEILNSRIDGTKLIVDSLKKLSKKPKVFISASAVGFYGYTDAETIFTEKSTLGEGILR